MNSTNGLIKVVFLILVAINSYASESPDQKCQRISCEKFPDNERWQCLRGKQLCHQKAFEKQLELWKVSGIKKGDKEKIIEALEKSSTEIEKRKELISKRLRELIRDQEIVKESINSVKELKIIP